MQPLDAKEYAVDDIPPPDGRDSPDAQLGRVQCSERAEQRPDGADAIGARGVGGTSRSEPDPRAEDIGLANLSSAPLPGRLFAVESVRTLPTTRALFRHAKIVNVLEGSLVLETADRTAHVAAGTSFALGAGRWCRITPTPRARMWTVYVDAEFFRALMTWFLPDRKRVKAGLPPYEWEGDAILNSPGLNAMRQIEPVWRQMSLLHDSGQTPEAISVQTVELFARWMRTVAPSMVAERVMTAPAPSVPSPIEGRLTSVPYATSVRLAAELLRERMREQWTVSALAREVAVSRSHLTRLFSLHYGAPPMRFLTEIRLTEFTRLIEETDMSIEMASRAVGWADPRVASGWFVRRFGRSPSQYRSKPHPHHGDATSGLPAVDREPR